MLKYFQSNSFLHRLDARVKLVCLLFLVAAAVLNPLPSAIPLAVLVVVLYAISGVRARHFSFELKALALAIVLIFAFRFLLGIGGFASVKVIGFLVPAWAFQALLNSLYIVSVSLLSMLFLFTTRSSQLREVLLFFRFPRQAAFALAMALQAVPLLQERLWRVRTAQIVRGSQRPVLALILPLLHSLFSRARTLSLSLESRGFKPD